MSEQAFFLYDLHLRTSPRQGMDDLVRKAADAGFRSFGVVGDVPGNDPFENFFSCFLSKTIAYPQKCLPLRRQMRNMTSKRNGAFV